MDNGPLLKNLKKIFPILSITFLLGICLFIDPTISEDSKGGFSSWVLAYNLGQKSLGQYGDSNGLRNILHNEGKKTIEIWRISLIFTYFLSVITTFFLFHSKNRVIRYLSYLLFLICSTVIYTYQKFNIRFSPALIGLIKSESSFFQEYIPIIIGTSVPFFICLTLLLFLYSFISKKKSPVRVLYATSCSLIVLSCTLLLAAVSDGIVMNSSPLFKVPSAVAFYYLLASKNKIVRRDEPYFLPDSEHKVKNIILLVDESITGEYLQINGFPISNTPYLISRSEEIINFGLTSSLYSFTEYSHKVLQSGIRKKDLPDYKKKIYKMPSIFQYAKSAQYNTAFIDTHYKGYAYTRNPILQEIDFLKYTDRYISLLEKYEKRNVNIDYMAVDEIINFLKKNRGEKSFVYAFKQGLHIPFEGRYPPEKRVFTPTPATAKYVNGNNVENENSYSNGVLWAVDGLLKYLTDGLRENNLEDTLIVYTSDHGSRIKLREADWITSSFNVPLLVFYNSIAENLRNELEDAELLNRDKLSHEDIFPSLLYLMGYAKSDIKKSYGITMFDPHDKNGRVVFKGDIFGSDGEKIFQFTNSLKNNMDG